MYKYNGNETYRNKAYITPVPDTSIEIRTAADKNPPIEKVLTNLEITRELRAQKIALQNLCANNNLDCSNVKL